LPAYYVTVVEDTPIFRPILSA